jgi:hypothetical protein
MPVQAGPHDGARSSSYGRCMAFETVVVADGPPDGAAALRLGQVLSRAPAADLTFATVCGVNVSRAPTGLPQSSQMSAVRASVMRTTSRGSISTEWRWSPAAHSTRSSPSS